MKQKAAGENGSENGGLASALSKKLGAIEMKWQLWRRRSPLPSGQLREERQAAAKTIIWLKYGYSVKTGVSASEMTAWPEENEGGCRERRREIAGRSAEITRRGENIKKLHKSATAKRRRRFAIMAAA